jgi:class 3 adenylate cyclase/streptogramin lyase
LIKVPIQKLISKIDQHADNKDTPELLNADFKFYWFDDNITKIISDGSGDMWFNTRTHIKRYVETESDKNGVFINYLETFVEEDSLVGWWARSVVEDPGSWDKNRFGGDGWEHTRASISIFLDNRQMIWASTANRLYQFLDKKENQHIHTDSTIKFLSFTQSLYSDHRRNEKLKFQDKWINTYDMGEDINYGGAMSFTPIKNSIWLFHADGSKIDIFNLEYQENQKVRFNKVNEFRQNLRDKSSWNLNIHWTYFLDKEGILWISDRSRANWYHNGLLKLNTQVMSQFRTIIANANDKSTLPNILYPSIFRDYSGHVWFFPQTEDLGFYISDPYFTNFKQLDLPIKTSMSGTLTIDNNQNIWYANSVGDLYIINTRAFHEGKDISQWHKRLGAKEFGIVSHPDNHFYIEDLLTDETGVLWISTASWNETLEQDIFRGLYYFDPGKSNASGLYKELKFQKYEFDDPIYNGENQSPVSSAKFVKGNTQMVYLKTDSSLISISPESHSYKVFLLDKEETDPYSKVSRLFGYESYDDGLLNLYGVHTLNSWESFLVHFRFSNQEQLEFLTTTTYDDKTFPELVGQLVMDKNFNLWFRSDYSGLFNFDTKTEQLTEYLNEYTAPGGLVGWGPGNCDKQGYIYTVTTGSILVFHPDNVWHNPVIPKINISDIHLNGKSIIKERDSTLLNALKSSRTLTIPYDRNNVAIDFNSMSLSKSSNNKFKYRLQGWDKEWNESHQSNRTATYSKLSPGSYHFQVIGSNNAGIWNEEGTSVSIIIQPPWWLTNGAKVSYFFLFVVCIGAIIHFHSRLLRKERRIFKAIGKFVPFEFLQYLGKKSVMDIKLGDHLEQEVTVLFSDIRDYTSLSEEMTPGKNFKFINSYLSRMGPIVKRNKGFVNQFIGDSIMAIFPKNATYALIAAIEMEKEIQKYNKHREEFNRKPIRAGIGIHTGQLMMGLIGYEQRVDTASIAHTVNVASRMESMTKFYGVNILLSESSFQSIDRPQDFCFRHLGSVIVKGKKDSFQIYECCNGDTPEVSKMKKASIDDFHTGVEYFHNKEFNKASQVFEEIFEMNPYDKPAKYYYKVSRKFSSKGVKASWDGASKVRF